MALIEGADASLFNTGKEDKKTFSWSWNKFTLKVGMLFMGIAVGIVMGAVPLKCRSSGTYMHLLVNDLLLRWTEPCLVLCYRQKN